jgi:hypothetical protein
MQTPYGESLMDSCKIWTYAATQAADGEMIVTAPVWAAIAETACGFDPRGSSERWRSDATLGVYDAMLRVAHATTIAPKDRVQLTKRYGVAVTTIIFEVAGPPLRGPAGQQAPLKAVT